MTDVVYVLLILAAFAAVYAYARGAAAPLSGSVLR